MELLGYLFVIGVFLIANPILGLIVYLIPAILAALLRKTNTFPIIVLDILFGWFLPVWIALLLWSVFGKMREGSNYKVGYERKDKICQFCPKFFPMELTSCPHCGKEQRTIDS
ncbi:TPA: superinfection immunity protein [Klebsiella variicola]|uniref:superinfection immunity protein n=1 Tax=Klebsiella quasipneumoniae TaxID=1463165 RepID=UPI002B0D6A5B|nr:superinfection immunity protein [Klebsiella variicola]